MLARLLVPAVAVCILAVRDTPRAQPPAPGLLPPATIGTATIAGRVVIAGTDPAEPVRRGRVTQMGGVLSEAQVTDTDTDGRYGFERLPAGAYRVRAEKPGYVTLEYGATRPFVAADPIELRQGQTAVANIALPRGAALEGHVTNEAGEPMPNVIVSAMRFAYGPNGRRRTSVRQARTNDLGRYRVHSLPAGQYYIESAIGPLQAASVPPGARSSGFARTYYPGTPRVDEARALTLKTGEEIGNLDFSLAAVPVATLNVQVLDASGKAPANASLRLQAVGGPVGELRGFGDPRNRSLGTFRGVPPGEYWLTGAAMPSTPGDPEFTATRVTVSGQDQSRTVTTERGARIDGRIEIDAAGPPLSFAGLQVVPIETEFELPNPGRPAAPPPTVPIGAEGRFLITSLFGPRIVRLNRLPPAWALKHVWLDDVDITDTVVDYRASNAARPMRIVLTDRTASVSGTVADDRQRPADEYQVIAFADDEEKWTPRSRFVRIGRRAPGGRFTLEGLLPANYLIAAIEPQDDDSWSDPQLLRRLRAIASKLTLAEGDRQTIALTLKAVP